MKFPSVILVLMFAYVAKSSQLQQDQVQNEVADIRFELLENMIAGLTYDRQECINKLYCLVTKDDNFTSLDLRTPILELSYLMNNVTERKSKFPTLSSLVDAVQDGQCHKFDCPQEENSLKEDLAYILGTSTDSRVKRDYDDYADQSTCDDTKKVEPYACVGAGVGCAITALFTFGLGLALCGAVGGAACVSTAITQATYC